LAGGQFGWDLEENLEMAVLGLLDDPDLEPSAVRRSQRQKHRAGRGQVRADADRSPGRDQARLSDEERLPAVREYRGRYQERRRDCGGARDHRPNGFGPQQVTATA
jgi:hypothetical protein